MIFNLDFGLSTISLSSFSCFFSIIDLYFLISAVIAQIFKPTAELLIPIGMQIKEAKAEIEMHPVTKEASRTNLFVLLNHQFILIYFCNEIISCFIHMFQSNFLACPNCFFFFKSFFISILAFTGNNGKN